ncbi:MAG TPA: FtsX-like permease family protein [Roseiflexaceae bacterium]|jgi:putative ABC transport system permease protein|nr:FtsX-like permease family protein [Roseiflexaceae bacterium]
MTPTLFKTSLRHLLRHPWQVGLAILGVALGVAVVVAIDLANDSARRAFTLSTETLTGPATHQIVGGPEGLDDAIYRQLRVELGMRQSAPLIEGYAAAPDHPGLTLHILGIDPFAESSFRPYLTAGGQRGPGSDLTALLTQPGTALMSAGTAQAYNITNGSDMRLRFGPRTVTARVIGLLQPQDEQSSRALDGLMITDIATAQEWMGMVGKLSQIDLVLPEGPAGAAAQQQIEHILPPGARLVQPATRTETLQQMTAAFELNLTALSMLALIVGMFLIYNTITFSVVQRRGLLGTLRCIGVTRGQIFVLVLGEALGISMIGSAAGLLLGVALGRGLVGLVTQTINDLYFVVSVRDVAISSGPLIKGFALGVLATLVAAAVPAVEATLTPPRTVLRRSSYEERIRQAVPLASAVGGGLLLVGMGLLLIPSKSIVLSFAALFCITIGAAALTPGATLLFMRAARPLLGRMMGLLGRMAARDVIATLSRTSVAIAALMIAVSVTIGVGLMVSSFRQTVIQWLDATLQADIYVSAPGQSATRVDTTLPPDLLQRFQNVPGVAGIRRYRNIEADTPNGSVIVIGTDVDPQRDRAAYQFAEGDPASIWPDFDSGAVLVSEPLAYRRNLHPGSMLTVFTGTGEKQLRVTGIFYDYGSDQGVVMMKLDHYRALWNDQAISSLAVYAAPGMDVDTLVQRLRDHVGADEVIQIQSNKALRAASLEIFDRTFAITSVLQLLAMIVAFVGILSALMALQLERARELGTLRAIGLTPGQLWGVVLSQTGLIGLVAGLLAIPLGVALAMVLVFVINKRSFGWTLQFQLDGGLFLQALLVAIVAALLAGLYPAWRMSRTAPALALREE